MTNLANIPANTTLPVNRAQPIIVRSVQEAWDFATTIVKGGVAPKGLQPAGVMIIVMAGADRGWSPADSLQKLTIINGKVSIYGDTAIGLVRASGQMEWIRETLSENQQVATCTVKRRSDPEPHSQTFSMADARQAKLLGKVGPWQDYPQRMLKMRARSWCLRDVFADVLDGLSLAEEAEARDIPQQSAPEVTPPAGSVAEEPPPVPTVDEHEDPAATAQRIIDSLDAMNVEGEVRDFMTDNSVWEALEAGAFSRQSAQAIEAAFRSAIERATQSDDEPPDPNGD